jgi:hypothetical protein
MNPETGNSECEHEWIEYDDPVAYRAGLNCPTLAICNKCGAQQDIRYKYAGINKLKWYEYIVMIPLFLVTTLYLITIAPIIMIISGIKDEFISKRKTG